MGLVQRAILLFCVLLWCSCERATKPASTANQPDSPSANVLGRLAALTNEVRYRRSAELEWNPGILSLELFSFDAVVTDRASSARIALEAGSEINMEEETLVILNPAGSEVTRHGDRAVVRKGNLEGLTSSELWLITSAASLRLRPKGSARLARARVQVNEGKKVRVELTAGEGEAQFPDARPAVKLTENIPVDFAAPLPPVQFGFVPDVKLTGSRPSVAPIPKPPAPPAKTARRKVEGRRKPAATVPESPKLPPTGLEILSPANHAQVEVDEILLRGRVGSADAELVVNGRPTPVDKNGNFSVTIPLVFGGNQILLQVSRQGNEPTTRQWFVVRKQ